jgi:hypothetical protein
MLKHLVLSFLVGLTFSVTASAEERPAWFSPSKLLEKSGLRTKALAIAEARVEAEAIRRESRKQLENSGLAKEIVKEHLAKMDALFDSQFKKLSAGNSYKLGDSGDLKFVFQLLYLAQNDDDPIEAARIIKQMFPNQDAVDLAFKPETGADAKKALLAMYDKIRPVDDDQEGWIKLMNPPSERHEIRVYAASTEEIAANKEKVAEEFPSGVVVLAKTTLRKEMTFYEVEMLEPGKESGTKFHLFFWTGTQWRMLGPAWRAF